jgi:hypothetical protein
LIETFSQPDIHQKEGDSNFSLSNTNPFSRVSTIPHCLEVFSFVPVTSTMFILVASIRLIGCCIILLGFGSFHSVPAPSTELMSCNTTGVAPLSLGIADCFPLGSVRRSADQNSLSAIIFAVLPADNLDRRMFLPRLTSCLHRKSFLHGMVTGMGGGFRTFFIFPLAEVFALTLLNPADLFLFLLCRAFQPAIKMVSLLRFRLSSLQIPLPSFRTLFSSFQTFELFPLHFLSLLQSSVPAVSSLFWIPLPSIH